MGSSWYWKKVCGVKDILKEVIVVTTMIKVNPYSGCNIYSSLIGDLEFLTEFSGINKFGT